jgi:hypothetical protein
MINDHWFDTLNKRLTRTSPRRGILSAATLSILHHLGAPDAAGKGGGKGGKHKGGGKGKKGGGGKHGHGKGKGNKKPPKPRGICDRTWPGTGQQDDRDHCRRIFRQCPPDESREFCIVDNFPGHEGDDVAVCCKEGETCCGAQCCPADHHCCGKYCCESSQPCCGGVCGPNEAERDIKCCNGLLIGVSSDQENCGGCGVRCGADEVCVDRQCQCSGTQRRSAAGDASSCDDCPDGRTRCGGVCVDTKWDQNHCGGCYAANPDNLSCCNGALCPQGMPCHNGVCTCGTYNYCHHRDLGWVCFSDDCSLIE